MHRVLTLAWKDLLLLFRDKYALFWVLGFPLMFGLFFGAITGGGTRGRIEIAVIDEDDSADSRAFVEKLSKHESLRLAAAETLKVDALGTEQATDLVRKGRLAAFITIKKGFGDNLLNFGGGGGQNLTVGLDPARKAEAGFLQGILMETNFKLAGSRFSDPQYLKTHLAKAREQIDRAADLGLVQKLALKQLFSSLEDFAAKMGPDLMQSGGPFGGGKLDIVAVASDRARPRTSFEVTFPSSILWAIMGCMISFAVSIVVERKQGTLLRLQIAPISRGEILAGKGLACFLACLAAATFLLVVGWLFFRVQIDRPLWLVLGMIAASLGFVGIMMFLAVLGKTEQAVAGSASAIMLVMAMFGGGMVPLFFMPEWMGVVSHFSPVKWGILALEGAIWRGFSFTEMLLPCGILLTIGAIFYAVGVFRLARQEN